MNFLFEYFPVIVVIIIVSLFELTITLIRHFHHTKIKDADNTITFAAGGFPLGSLLGLAAIMAVLGFAYDLLLPALAAVPAIFLIRLWRYKKYPPRLIIERNKITLVDQTSMSVYTHRIRSISFNNISEVLSIGDTSTLKLEFSPSQFPDKDSYQDFMLWLLDITRDQKVEFTDNLIEKFKIGQMDGEE